MDLAAAKIHRIHMTHCLCSLSQSCYFSSGAAIHLGSQTHCCQTAQLLLCFTTRGHSFLFMEFFGEGEWQILVLPPPSYRNEVGAACLKNTHFAPADTCRRDSLLNRCWMMCQLSAELTYATMGLGLDLWWKKQKIWEVVVNSFPHILPACKWFL